MPSTERPLMEQFQILLRLQADAAGTSEDVTFVDAPELPTKETKVRKAHFDVGEDADADYSIWQEAQAYEEAWAEASNEIAARQPPAPSPTSPVGASGSADDEFDDDTNWVHTDLYNDPNGDAEDNDMDDGSPGFHRKLAETALRKRDSRTINTVIWWQCEQQRLLQDALYRSQAGPWELTDFPPASLSGKHLTLKASNHIRTTVVQIQVDILETSEALNAADGDPEFVQWIRLPEAVGLISRANSSRQKKRQPQVQQQPQSQQPLLRDAMTLDASCMDACMLPLVNMKGRQQPPKLLEIPQGPRYPILPGN